MLRDGKPPGAGRKQGAATSDNTNGRSHERNGHKPESRLPEPGTDAKAPSLAEVLASAASPAAAPPLDAVSTVDGPEAKPKPAGEKSAADGRTSKGTFAAGNQFARGNPNARKMAALRAALLESMTPERMKALGERLYTAAMAGNWIAAKLLLAYAIGKAPEAVNPDRLDLDEWAIADAMPTTGQVLRAMVDGVPAADAAAFRATRLAPDNDPARLIDRLNEEIRKRENYDPPGQLTRQFLDERAAHVGKCGEG
jgi:hypothetical protein